MKSKRNGFRNPRAARTCGLCGKIVRYAYCKPCAEADRAEIARLRGEHVPASRSRYRTRVERRGGAYEGYERPSWIKEGDHVR